MNDETQLSLGITMSSDGATVTVAVTGEVDALYADEVCAVATTAVEQSETSRIVVDLSGVDFMDSSGLSALIECCRTVRSAHRGFGVVSASGSTLRLLDLTGLTDYFKTSTDQSESADHS